MAAGLLQTALDRGRDVAAALGMGGILWSAYTVSGLPVPATIKQVDERIAGINQTISGLRFDHLESRRETVRLARISLRNEKGAIERTLPDLDGTTRATMNRRMGEIEDQLKEYDALDMELRQRMKEIQPK
jgi:hypothetical protein